MNGEATCGLPTYDQALSEIDQGSARSSFEQWVAGPPYERETERWPQDETTHAWPDQYKDIAVQLAWEAWCEARCWIVKTPGLPIQPAGGKLKP